MYYVLKHPSTDKVIWTEDWAKANQAFQRGFSVIVTTPIKPEELQ